ncbi:sulfite exporter TauE/SafE family protein [Tsukamurella ocularis]|uniref:sulfite exporter TauE/SafE family protein n=1 Tax=Tsukamurella ocularis TaxID=1970234 RepID=UPI00216825E8|nr:sulfite exporter TauE/SafE family protein [Tsukamurella ocularis]MCS3781753.1 putative membrane protein YfcA [Tsukamurella ocularis]MCS3788247.1 putative membrane protein YfcA [Tsukamurella ocularis]MCS3851967.1 putative membrane protein YfcA [Tsukamurella ocularis]
MPTLVIVAFVGLLGQLVDGSLGMAFGVTATTFLVALTTLSPAAISATIHLAEIGTSAVSGASHWRFGNVDWKVVRRIGIPGAIGAFVGATVLSNLSTEVAKPLMSIILLLLGLYVLLRFTFRGIDTKNLGKPLKSRFLAPLGLFGGFVDATGGGGWGPVGTPALLASGRMEPRKVVGTIDTSEFLIALAASLGFLANLGGEGVNFAYAGAILLGGVIAAPFAAWLVRHFPPRLLGASVGGLIILTNARTLVGKSGLALDPGTQRVVYILIVAGWIAAFAYSFVQYRRDSVLESADSISYLAARNAGATEDPKEPVPA